MGDSFSKLANNDTFNTTASINILPQPDWYQTAVKEYKINEISYKELSREKRLIGRGGFGYIYQTIFRPVGNVAIKEFATTYEDINDNDCINNFIREVKNYSRIEHERVIRFHGISQNDGLYYLILEYANQGDLRKFLSERNFEWIERINLAIQIAEGLLYLHTFLDIAHRDLHTKNILVSDGSIKISDFGFSRNLNSTVSSKNRFIGVIPFIDVQKVINNGFMLDKSSDIYSLGVILWEISSYRAPFFKVKGEIDLINHIKQGYREKPVKGTPIKYIQIYTGCCEPKPGSRPLIKEVLQSLSQLRSKSSFGPLNEDPGENPEEYFKVDLEEISQTDWIQNVIKEGFASDISWKDLTNIEGISSGAFGTVYRAYWSKINDYIALKKLDNLNNSVNSDDSYNIQHEIQMQSRAHTCENIIRFLGITQASQGDLESNDYYIVMEYADGGNLRSYLQKNFSSLCWDEKYRLALDITNGVHYLHENDIVHRDLHAKNIVIRKGTAKITDFGLAKRAEVSTSSKQVFGIAPYIAPELLGEYPQYSKESDIYSLGVLLWEISSGYPPFQKVHAPGLMLGIINGVREKIIPNTPVDYSCLYIDCWNGNPKERPTIKDVYGKLKNMFPKNAEIIYSIDLIDPISSNNTIDTNGYTEDFQDSQLCNIEITEPPINQNEPTVSHSGHTEDIEETKSTETPENGDFDLLIRQNESVITHVEWLENAIKNKEIAYYNYRQDFENVSKIGSGSFATVYSVILKSAPSDILAIKRFHDNSTINEVVSELQLMRKVRFHPNIISFRGVTKLKDQMTKKMEYLLVLECADNGTLRDYLKKYSKNFKWNDQLKFAMEIASAISCLHYNGILHRDLHSHNILIHQDTVKLSDFGLSRRLQRSVHYTKKAFGAIPYMDPIIFESLTKEANQDHLYRLTKKSDIYSLGVLFWELTSGGLSPFESEEFKNEYLMHKILEGTREQPISNTNPKFVELYEKCWRHTPDERPNIREIIDALDDINSESN